MKTFEMTGAQAAKLDKNGDFYADYDASSGLWCVFGTESGFAYGSYASEEEANEKARKHSKR